MQVTLSYKLRLRLRWKEQNYSRSELWTEKEIRKTLQRRQNRLFMGTYLRSLGEFHEKVHKGGKEPFSSFVKNIEGLWLNLWMLARKNLHWLKLNVWFPGTTALPNVARKICFEIGFKTQNGHQVFNSRKILGGSRLKRSIGINSESRCGTEKRAQMINLLDSKTNNQRRGLKEMVQSSTTEQSRRL